MASLETFRASVYGILDVGTAVVFDYSYVDNTGGSTHIDTGVAAGNFQTLVQTTMAAALPAGFTFTKYRFACVTGTHNGEIGFVDVSPPVTGAMSDEMLPPEICISLQRNTGHSSRHDRGRVFFGPVHPDYQDPSDHPDKVQIDANLTAVANLGKAVLTTSGVDLTPCLLSSAGEWNNNAIINVKINPIFCHRRTRRLRAPA